MTTRVVVLSDTHMPRRALELPTPLLEALQDADLIFHLGDLTEAGVLSELSRFAPVTAVRGNNDCPELLERLPLVTRAEIDEHRFVLLHGHLGGRTALDAARAVRDADAVLFGHSHRAHCSIEAGRLLFNPGSPTDRRWSAHRSFGVLDVAAEIMPAIIPIL